MRSRNSAIVDRASLTSRYSFGRRAGILPSQSEEVLLNVVNTMSAKAGVTVRLCKLGASTADID